jgi:DNA polymerase (family X)
LASIGKTGGWTGRRTQQAYTPLMQSTREVALALEEIASLLEFAGELRFKVNAYARAAEVVNTLGDELAPLVEQGRLRELEGIGGTLARQIEEIYNTGSSEYLERLRREQPPGVGELVQVQGLTPRRVRALHDALGIASVLELRDACATGRVREIRGFGAKTEAKLLAGCERWLTRGERAPDPVLLPRALELSALLQKRMSGPTDVVELVGALRRAEESVRELEFVVTGDPGRALERAAGLRQVLRTEPAQGLAHLTDALLLRLHPATPETLGNALVLHTGNAAHVDALLARSRARGIAFRAEPGAATVTPFESEARLYEALDLALVPPELRHGRDELLTAEREGFSDLVALEDIQGLVHCHTTFSDGKNTILEMARAAHDLGMKYITITDHSPSAHYARGVALDRIQAQWDEIAAAEEQVPIRILRGTESDILSDGSLDFPDSVLERFDVIIASIHARHRMDGPAMTARLARALSLPVFKIWGHALGRILNHRPSIECDVPRLLDELAASRGAVEINADPHRLDLPPAWIPAVRERGIPFVVSVDAHSTRGFGVLRYGISMARRGGVRRAEVLNALPADAFAASVRPVSWDRAVGGTDSGSDEPRV